MLRLRLRTPSKCLFIQFNSTTWPIFSQPTFPSTSDVKSILLVILKKRKKDKKPQVRCRQKRQKHQKRRKQQEQQQQQQASNPQRDMKPVNKLWKALNGFDPSEGFTIELATNYVFHHFRHHHSSSHSFFKTSQKRIIHSDLFERFLLFCLRPGFSRRQQTELSLFNFTKLW